MTGHTHNAWLAFTRIFSAIGAAALAEQLKHDRILGETAQDFARFEARRYSAACYAYGTTKAALEASR